MRTVTIEARVWSHTRNETIASHTFGDLDIMKTAKVRQWCTRNFNLALKAAARDEIICVSYYGQLAVEPYNSHSGGLTGLNGKIMRREGEYDHT